MKKRVKFFFGFSPNFYGKGGPFLKNQRIPNLHLKMAHYQQYYNQNLHVLPIQLWYCTSFQWYNNRNTPNLNSFCWNAKMMSFSNLTLTLFNYFLFASTMYKHIFGLILVTQEDLGVKLNHNYRFSIIWLYKSNFPTYWWACAPKII